MYIPAYFEVSDRAELVSFMRAHNFAAIVSMHEGKLTATHVPLAIHDDADGIRFVGHFAKANSHWQSIVSGVEALVVFTGPHAYISPSLYESKLSVPTWNYTAVHAYAAGREIDATPALMELVEATDAGYRRQWDELTPEFRDKMLAAVVAFELRVTALEGKYKLSQNRPLADRLRVAEAHAGTELGEMMQKMARAAAERKSK